jgi:hypothetical protein
VAPPFQPLLPWEEADCYSRQLARLLSAVGSLASPACAVSACQGHQLLMLLRRLMSALAGCNTISVCGAVQPLEMRGTACCTYPMCEGRKQCCPAQHHHPPLQHQKRHHVGRSAFMHGFALAPPGVIW